MKEMKKATNEENETEVNRPCRADKRVEKRDEKTSVPKRRV